MDELLYPCLACLIIGALGGFVAGMKVAEAMLANINRDLRQLKRQMVSAKPAESDQVEVSA
jgi:hypothetical protein